MEITCTSNGRPAVPSRVSAFLVPTDTPGLERREIKGKLGLRGQATSEIFLTDVRVPESARLGEEGKGFRIAMQSLDKGRVSVGAGCVGIIQGCLEAVVDYAVQRRQFGRQLASFQLVQDMIADISVNADAARLLVWRAADLIERGEPFGTAASRPSTSPARPPSGPPTWPSRSSAATGTSTSTRSRSTCGMLA